MATKPNILILMTDHFSPDVIGAYGDVRAPRPTPTGARTQVDQG